MNTEHITAIIIEENLIEAQRIEKAIAEQCPNIVINEIGTTPIETKKIINEGSYDIIIMGLKVGKDYAFEILQKTSLNIQDKELILTSTEPEGNLKTYRNSAIDYILKPLEPLGIMGAIEKAEQKIMEQKELHNLTRGKSKPLNLVAIPSTNDVKIIKVSDILYLKSEGKYTIFHTSKGKQVVSSTNLGAYEKKLAQNNFFRIHNSFLVNMDSVVNVQKKDGVYVEINNRDMIPVAKRKKESLFYYLGIK
ncbi:hypothetical protein A8C32_18190 [Flavivirga aquatica]|uniref:HTH LytTR-type domain-containing protein n=1 Tax=Flavivirga aquatica TaxID=1849968 RepID=A0A1E5T7T4_9FLAO|nr:LytTR family DNA-binding domain-containing protein [Flavivirga aquatica]OEK07367.1 hypothetical protein A8C32_18190 [Flavivirga aquatica]